MQGPQVISKEESSRLAERIVELSSRVLSTKENPGYIALNVGDGPFSNVMTVRWRKNRVSFHMPSSDLETQATAAGFSPADERARQPLFKHKRYFYGLTLADLQSHEPLFRAIVKDSLEYVLSQRPKGK